MRQQQQQERVHSVVLHCEGGETRMAAEEAASLATQETRQRLHAAAPERQVDNSGRDDKNGSMEAETPDSRGERIDVEDRPYKSSSSSSSKEDDDNGTSSARGSFGGSTGSSSHDASSRSSRSSISSRSNSARRGSTCGSGDRWASGSAAGMLKNLVLQSERVAGAGSPLVTLDALQTTKGPEAHPANESEEESAGSRRKNANTRNVVPSTAATAEGRAGDEDAAGALQRPTAELGSSAADTAGGGASAAGAPTTGTTAARSTAAGSPATGLPAIGASSAQAPAGGAPAGGVPAGGATAGGATAGGTTAGGATAGGATAGGTTASRAKRCSDSRVAQRLLGGGTGGTARDGGAASAAMGGACAGERQTAGATADAATAKLNGRGRDSETAPGTAAAAITASQAADEGGRGGAVGSAPAAGVAAAESEEEEYTSSEDCQTQPQASNILWAVRQRRGKHAPFARAAKRRTDIRWTRKKYDTGSPRAAAAAFSAADRAASGSALQQQNSWRGAAARSSGSYMWDSNGDSINSSRSRRGGCTNQKDGSSSRKTRNSRGFDNSSRRHYIDSRRRHGSWSSRDDRTSNRACKSSSKRSSSRSSLRSWSSGEFEDSCYRSIREEWGDCTLMEEMEEWENELLEQAYSDILNDEVESLPWIMPKAAAEKLLLDSHRDENFGLFADDKTLQRVQRGKERGSRGRHLMLGEAPTTPETRAAANARAPRAAGAAKNVVVAAARRAAARPPPSLLEYVVQQMVCSLGVRHWSSFFGLQAELWLPAQQYRSALVAAAAAERFMLADGCSSWETPQTAALNGSSYVSTAAAAAKQQRQGDGAAAGSAAKQQQAATALTGADERLSEVRQPQKAMTAALAAVKMTAAGARDDFLSCDYYRRELQRCGPEEFGALPEILQEFVAATMQHLVAAASFSPEQSHE